MSPRRGTPPVVAAHLCGETPTWDQRVEMTRWKLERDPVCNRPPAHSGKHREYVKGTPQVLAEWPRKDER